MTIKFLNSNSDGNCSILKADNGKTLLLDLGVNKSNIMKALNYNIMDIEACLVSHCHQDHSKSLADFRDMGLPMFAPYLTDGKPQMQRYENFSIQCFELPHDNTPNYGFYIRYLPNSEQFLYMTDFEYCKFNFKKLGIQNIFIEVNYQKELVNKDLPNLEHKVRGHCSLDYCKQFLSDNATDKLRNVILLHLGLNSAIPEQCIDEVQKIVPRANVYVASKGLEVNLDEVPF